MPHDPVVNSRLQGAQEAQARKMSRTMAKVKHCDRLHCDEGRVHAWKRYLYAPVPEFVLLAAAHNDAALSHGQSQQLSMLCRLRKKQDDED